MNRGREIFFSLSDGGLYGRFPFRTPAFRTADRSFLLARRDRTMFGGSDNSDKALQKLVDRRLQRSGGGGSGVRAVVMRGSVTLSGNLKYENQRMPLLKALRGVAGVRNVLDQLKVLPKQMPYSPRQAGG